MKNKKTTEENYLEKIPVHPEGLQWSADEKGIVTLDIENKGWMNRIFQKFFKKPRFTHIHLDEIGSFVWPLIDGEKRIMDMGEPMEQHFGERAHPTFERLAKFFQILDSYGFVKWREQTKETDKGNHGESR
ncbi:MAG: PqqD family protein [Oscillospiraceae bacterium]|nr:PqqD family protein [Oscillospiraceae bacterium]